MASPGRLDWCCIGAQKAGTSTLYRLLRDHPDIVIPPGKEEPIFDAEVTAEQVRSYLDEQFADAGDARCGTVTPQYMTAPETAGRMYAFVPGARIVAVVRDPLKRAFSHYRMNVRWGLEQRSFDEAAASQIKAIRDGEPIDLYSETDAYLMRGRYAWLLEGWYEGFGPDNVLVLFNDDLDRTPAVVVERVQRFLGLEPRPIDERQTRFHVDPPPHRLSGLRRPVAGALRRVGILDRIHPERRERISSAIERVSARLLPAPPREIAPATVTAVRALYASDTARLAELIGEPIPWAG
jgi:hypothetical protein